MKTDRIPSTTLAPRTMADEVLALGDQVTSAAYELSDLVASKLEPIMGYPRPTCDEVSKGQLEAEMPPLLAKLRQQFQTINTQLINIRNYVERTEI